MFQVTERAAIALQEVLAINNAPPKRGVRLVPTDEGRLGMTIDRPREGDRVVQRDDTPVLIVDRQMAAALTGVVLDLQPAETEPEGPPRFTLRRQRRG
jgi:Fe-S cluster assembly iron-binding protein IscA